jgi:hypothetical protein
MNRKEREQHAHIIAETINRRRSQFETRAELRDEVNWRTDNELGFIELDVITDMVNARLTQRVPE